MVVRNLRADLRKLLRGLGVLQARYPQLGLGVTQCHTLIELSSAPRSLSSLCDFLEIDSSTGSRNLSTLRRRGFVESECDATDPRRKLFRLTADGRRKVRAIHKHGDEAMRGALAHLTPDEQEKVSTALGTLAKAVERSQRREVRIRRSRRSDNGAIADVVREVLTELGIDREGSAYGEPETDQLHDVYERAEGCYLVVEHERRVRGGGGVLPHSPTLCEVKHFYFAREVRGGGHAKRLLNELLTFARTGGFRQVFLETHRRDMRRAFELYKAFGFRAGSAPAGYRGHSACNTIMSLSLLSQ